MDRVAGWSVVCRTLTAALRCILLGIVTALLPYNPPALYMYSPCNKVCVHVTVPFNPIFRPLIPSSRLAGTASGCPRCQKRETMKKESDILSVSSLPIPNKPGQWIAHGEWPWPRKPSLPIANSQMHCSLSSPSTLQVKWFLLSFPSPPSSPSITILSRSDIGAYHIDPLQSCHSVPHRNNWNISRKIFLSPSLLS